MYLRLRFCFASLIVVLGLCGVSADQATVSQKGKMFSVETITVHPGDEVIFKNDDDVVHNVFTNTKGLEFNLKAQAPGSQAGQVFKDEGVALVRCAFHPKMKMTVVVKK